MLRLAIILHLFIGATLAGVGVIVALMAGTDTGFGLFLAALVGFFAGFPVSWKVSQVLYAR
ncbi:CTP synthetase [Shimia sp.]|uniref:CTP synthetase n=1 Tax=Shimia sp. TaxID=1954381 RepID=UPI003B8BF87A